jgi:two-component system sensor kinase FixL
MTRDLPISEEITAEVLRTIGALVVVLDSAGKIILFNQACESTTGYSTAEADGRYVWDFLLPDEEVEPVKGVFAKLSAGQFPNSYTNHWIAKSGDHRLIEWSNTALVDEGGAVKFVVGTGLDVTERKLADDALRESEARLRTVFETAPDGIITIDEKGIIEAISPAAQSMFGFDEMEVIGNNVKMLIPQPYRDQHDGYIARYLETGEKRIIGVGRELTGQRKDGTTFAVDLTVGEIFVGGQRVFTGFVRDASGRKRAEVQVRELQADLVHVSRLSAMGEIASAITHELNQPLTAIMIYLQACQHVIKAEGALPEKIYDMMGKVVAQAERAGAIIHRLREFIEKGETERSEADINDVVGEACALAMVGAADMEIGLRMELSRRLPPVLIDKVQIQQVVFNLVRNAVDALEGADERELTIRSEPTNSSAIEISVRDTGPGIPPDVAKRLFEPFVTSKPDGMGIGLSISRSIIEAHRGRLWATSNPGGGTAFHFTLPVSARDGDHDGD